MFRNYFKIALRNLSKNKLTSTINIIGLAIGFMVAILSYLYIENEASYEKWIPENELIYRVFRQPKNFDGGWSYTPGPLAPTLMENVAGVAAATKIFPENELLFSVGDQQIYLEDIAYVDSTFFQVFPFAFKAGNLATALNGHEWVVMTERVAQLFFGTENPVGQTIRINGEYDYQITGVLENHAGNSHISQEVFVTLWESPQHQQWLSNNFTTYIKKEPNADLVQIAQRADDYLYPIYKRELTSINIPVQEKADFIKWKFQPLTDIHLHSENINGSRLAKGDADRLFIFGFIALIVLLIAGINYINLATARGTLRAKEVGMRKVSGAQRPQIVTQFLLESLIQALFALAVALVLSEFFLPFFNNMTNRELSFFGGDWVSILPKTLLMAAIVGVGAGLYPAFFLARYKPSTALKGGLLKTEGGQLFRKVLVVGQFALSVALIIVMVFVFKQ
ncbi:MAG: ABC transporter permease, partial [Bacteroidota bacterium]